MRKYYLICLLCFGFCTQVFSQDKEIIIIETGVPKPKRVTQNPIVILNSIDCTITISFSNLNEVFVINIVNIATGDIHFETIIISSTNPQELLIPFLLVGAYKLNIYNATNQYIGYFDV